MNELQQREFEMLKLFVGICEKLDLKYYLVCGSALGAAKYQGFIPWDDDIDVAMPRNDYETFLQKAQDMLPEWCFLLAPSVFLHPVRQKSGWGTKTIHSDCLRCNVPWLPLRTRSAIPY